MSASNLFGVNMDMALAMAFAGREFKEMPMFCVPNPITQEHPEGGNRAIQLDALLHAAREFVASLPEADRAAVIVASEKELGAA